MKVTSSCNASKTLNGNNMETLIGCQSESDIKQHPLLASCESEDSICQLIEIKKRKKVLSWSSLMKRLSPASEVPGALEQECKVPLFDQPLSNICGEDGTLPRPIQDILSILCLKGPSTEGIFRKAANEKARKELKEELNSGGMVDLESRPVHLLAVVLKDFLRSIPLKLLSSNLFQEWMGALDQQSEEDRIEALRQVVDKLPRPNRLLLKHLVCVLYLISKSAGTNKMDASNLAICIGPNMLALENDRSLSFEAQRDLNNKVKTLMEFLIDNCVEVFGENIPAPSSITSDDSLDHTDSSDVSTLQNDSAYDSTDADAESNSVIGSQSRLPQGPTKMTSSLDNRRPQSPRETGLKPIVSTVARLKGTLGQPDRRYSEPNMSSSQECLESRITSQKLTKSEDNFTVPRAASSFGSEDPEDPFPQDVFPAEGKLKRLLDLKAKSVIPGPVLPQRLLPKAASSCSLDGSCDSSPTVSSCSPKRNFFTRHQSFTMKTEKGKPNRELKKHSMSFSLSPHKRVQTQTTSCGTAKYRVFPRDPVKKSFKKDSQLAGRIIQESWPETHSQTALGVTSRACGFSADDVFQQVDQRLAGNPPSYEEALQSQAFELAAYRSQTVRSMRARTLSQDSIRPPPLLSLHGGDSGDTCSQEPLTRHRLSPLTGSWQHGETVCTSVATKEEVSVPGSSVLHRLRTVSESTQRSKQDYLVRRCSQPVFEADQLQYARESYI